MRSSGRTNKHLLRKSCLIHLFLINSWFYRLSVGSVNASLQPPHETSSLEHSVLLLLHRNKMPPFIHYSNCPTWPSSLHHHLTASKNFTQTSNSVVFHISPKPTAVSWFVLPSVCTEQTEAGLSTRDFTERRQSRTEPITSQFTGCRDSQLMKQLSPALPQTEMTCLCSL